MNYQARPAMWIALAIALAFAGGMFALWLVGYDAIRSTMCRPAEVHCWREWISATSGWFAGAAAILTMLTLLGQTSQFKKQTKLLTDQTAYLQQQVDDTLGNAVPVLGIHGSSPRERDAIIQFASTNQHRIEVEKISTSSASEVTIGSIPGWHATTDSDGNRVFEPDNEVRIVGYTERSVPPTTWSAHLQELEPVEAAGEKTSYNLDVQVTIKVCGASHTNHTLKANMLKSFSST